MAVAIKARFAIEVACSSVPPIFKYAAIPIAVSISAADIRRTTIGNALAGDKGCHESATIDLLHLREKKNVVAGVRLDTSIDGFEDAAVKRMFHIRTAG